MQKNMKGLVIFLVCLAGTAGVAFFMKATNKDACWFCSTSDYFQKGIALACKDDETGKKKALEYINMAAKDGYAPADLLFAQLYAGTVPEQITPLFPEATQCLSGSVAADGAQARKYLDQASELYDAMAENAERVEPDLAFRLGIMYLSPPFSEHDDVSSYKASDVGKKLLNVAAKGGNVEAMLKLAALEGAADNMEEAVKWYSKASGKKKDYRLSLKIGDIYLYGKGVAKDHEKAVEWYKKAQAQIKETKDLDPREKEHLLDIPSVRIQIASNHIERGGGESPVTVNYVLGGNGVHYNIKVKDKDTEGLIDAGEVIKGEKGIKAVVAKGIKLPEGTEREKDGFESMNQGMEWVLGQWVVSKYGKSRPFNYRLAR